jgi:hypothetical protein
MGNTAQTATAVFVRALGLVPLAYACTFEPAPMALMASDHASGPTSAEMPGMAPQAGEAPDPVVQPAAAPVAPTVACPLDCDDGDPCTHDAREAGGQGCDFACSHATIVVAQHGDQCCPSAATHAEDSDCGAVPGCGNGILEPGEECDGAEGCSALCQHRFDDSLIHRYSFDGSSRVVLDSVGDAHGVVMRGMLEGNGMLDLRGAPSNAYVELPPRLLSALGSATLEAWFTPTGDAHGQRLFDIGNRERDEDGMEQGTSYWALSPNNVVNGTLLMLINLTPTPDRFMGDWALPGSSALTMGTPYHVAAVLDASTREMLLYVNGALQADPMVIDGDLSELDDRNVWLGRSQFDGDPYLSAQLDEFRVYDRALRPSAIARSFSAGPNP